MQNIAFGPAHDNYHQKYLLEKYKTKCLKEMQNEQPKHKHTKNPPTLFAVERVGDSVGPVRVGVGWGGGDSRKVSFLSRAKPKSA